MKKIISKSFFCFILFHFLCFGAYSNSKSLPQRLPKRTASQLKNSPPQARSSARTKLPQRSPHSLNVNYNKQPVFLNRSQTIHPLCDKPATLECVSQWSRQAVPLVSQSGNSLSPTADYYLPSFVPYTQSSPEAESLVNEEVWEKFNSYLADQQQNSEVKFYRDRNDHDRIRRVTEDSDEEGNIVYINENFIKRNLGNYKITIGTHAFPATTQEIQDGCFILEKQSSQTEAGYCYFCNQSKDSHEILQTVGVDLNNSESHLTKTLDFFLEGVDAGTNQNINTKMKKSGDYEDKVCSPKIYLKKVIANFDRTCGMSFKDFFKESYCFSCSESIPIELMMSIMSIESAGTCNLTGVSGVNEKSLGLFQINVNAHKKCIETRLRKTSNLKQCLNHPVNNLMTSIGILKDKFREVNPSSASKELQNSTDQCSENSSWLGFSSKEKDYWRRAVSAYNGGGAWVTRAIASAEEYETVAKEGTDFLRNQNNSSYKEQEIPWETLRQLYFLETLAPLNKSNRVRKVGRCGIQGPIRTNLGRTGRRATCTISNLAYVESILGRDIRTNQPPLIEIWHQYKLEFLKERGGSISCRE